MVVHKKISFIGNVPVDWIETEWGNVALGFIGGSTPSRLNSDNFHGTIPWVTSGELNHNIIIDTIEKISKKAQQSTNLKLYPPGTFLMAITGLEATGTRGSCAILGINATTNQSCLAIFPTDKLDIKYLYYYYHLVSDKLAFTFCQGTKQQSYTANLVKKLPIVLPPKLSEQKHIASVLMNLDNLIESLEKLIVKKRLIKDGAMQELLTGKKRLPGFKGDWDCCKLVHVLKIFHGKSQHQIEKSNGKYPILATSGEIGRTDTPLYSLPSVLIGRKGTIDKPQYMDSPFWSIDTLFYTSIYSGNSAKFIYYLFILIDWMSYNEASGVPSLNAHVIEDIDVRIPPTLAEQTAIANLLTNMDNEITALEEKLAKYKQIKIGAMQQLLTGKIRLPIE